MIVTCEGCERRFQVDDARIPAKGARVRCKRCNHRFRVMPGGSPAATDGDASVDGESTLTGAPVAAAEAAGVPGGAAGSELRFVTEPPADAAAPDEDPAAAPDEDPVEAAAPAPEEDLAAAPVPDEDPAAEAPEQTPPVPDPGEQTIGEGSWEFGDSSLSFDEATPPAPPTSSRAADSSQSFIDAIPDEAPDEAEASGPGESPFEATTPPAARPEPSEPGDSTLRAVAPTAGADSVIFELTEDAAEESLELAEEEAGEGDAEPAEGAAPPEAEASATAAPEDDPADDVSLPEIGSVADWDRLAAEGAPAAGPAEPSEPAPEAEASFDFGDLDDDDPDPDWPDLSALPDAPVEPPPAPRRGGTAWLEHAGWALSVVLLLAVAQGTVRVEPGVPGVPPGRLDVAGLSAENVQGRFVDNARSGTLFVVTGELQNRSAEPLQPEGALQLVLLDAEGAVVGARPVAVGPALPEDAVREDPIGALSQRQEARAGELVGSELAPGQALAFTAVVAELSDAAVRYRIEAAPR